MSMFLSDKERAETIWACRFCMMCNVADSVAAVIKRESYTPRGRGAILFALERGFIKWDETVADIMYTTINDGLLREWCVGNYDHEELVLDARARLYEKGLAPDEVMKFIRQLRLGEGRSSDPVEILSKANCATDPSAETLLFCGCSARDSHSKSIVSMGKLFNKARVGFKVLNREPCCGWPLYQLGDLEGAKKFSTAVAEEIRASGASNLVVLDADCYRMFLTRTSRFGGNLKGIKIIHVTQLLAEWIKAGTISVAKTIQGPVTYHDPCALARYCDELDAPRTVLSAILQGELREMATSRKLANCCGAGGMLAVHRPDVSEKVALMRLQEAEETGAALLVTACTRCDEALTGAMQSSEKDPSLKVRNLVDLVAEAAGV